MLGANVIRSLLTSGAMAFDGQLRGDSLLLTIGGPLVLLRDAADAVDLGSEEAVRQLYEPTQRDWEQLVVAPRRVVLAQVSERLALRGRAFGIIGTLSHIARVGLMAHLASPFVAPNFDGFLTLELFNASGSPLLLRRGTPLAKVVLFEIDGHDADGRRPMYGGLGELESRFPVEFKSGGSHDV